MEPEHSELVRAWSAALHATSGSAPSDPSIHHLLSWLVHDLAHALTTTPFDFGAGARAGAALAAADLPAPDVVATSVPVLWSLASPVGDPETTRRMAVLLAKLGEGFGIRRQMLFAPPDAPGEVSQRMDERFRVVFDNAAVAIAIGDTNGVLLNANRALADMIGVPADDLRGISVYEFAHPEDRERIRRMVYERLVPHKQGAVKLEQQIGRADGSYGWAAFSITFVEGRDGHPDYLLAVGEDVTEQHRMREELHRQARHDLLTGLPNRRQLLEWLDSTIRDAGPQDRIGLCFVDLDRFKYINDRYGHGTGDKVLTAVANRLNDSVVELDCLVARIGGDEFVTLVPPPVDDDRMTEVAERLLGALSDPVTTGGHRLTVSASIGAVVTTVEGGQAEALLDAADTGLYHAKNSGKAQWVLHTLPVDGGTDPDPVDGGGPAGQAR
ncbi:diguanylate cyclase domain-containing protein [Nocardia flavorosea]|uniref:Diguanylate cyclase n=1 Tax=Nocardia flavorosea TaxID=53429 RepID=A0A846Y6J8_9NOCA|nr:diguanylate cyclase [Nocardia flavorosea]NKY55196.1 diguanylate cyclase [Nocardia flavorosea]